MNRIDGIFLPVDRSSQDVHLVIDVDASIAKVEQLSEMGMRDNHCPVPSE